jgi:uncharacterized protein YjbI with pentapeptide repeats
MRMVGEGGVGREGGKVQRPRLGRRWLWALAVVAAAVLVLFVFWAGPWLLTRYPSDGLTAVQELKARSDVRATLVQAVAGLAVAAGAIVTYRTFRQNEQDQASRHDREERTYRLNLAAQINDTYTKAVEQLGHDEAPVRLGALYSLMSLGQENPPRRQMVVDVLCAYLRMPFALPRPDNLDSRWAPRMLAQRRAANDVRGREAAQEHQLRQTAQRLLADHLRRPQDTSGEDAQSIVASHEETFWPGISVDLSGATLIDIPLRRMSVVDANFDGATFTGDANFGRATFTGDASFSRATFTGDASFDGATFTGYASFFGATFTVRAHFDGATFTGDASFGMATFTGDAYFRGATYTGNAYFGGATISGGATFKGVTFPDTSRGVGYVKVLRLNDPQLHNGGNNERRVWPEGWTVRADTYDPSKGTLVREQ